MFNYVYITMFDILKKIFGWRKTAPPKAILGRGWGGWCLNNKQFLAVAESEVHDQGISKSSIWWDRTS